MQRGVLQTSGVAAVRAVPQRVRIWIRAVGQLPRARRYLRLDLRGKALQVDPGLTLGWHQVDPRLT